MRLEHQVKEDIANNEIEDEERTNAEKLMVFHQNLARARRAKFDECKSQLDALHSLYLAEVEARKTELIAERELEQTFGKYPFPINGNENNNLAEAV